MPTQPESKRPSRRKRKIRDGWDAIWEAVGLSKLGDHLWLEIPHAITKSPFLLCALLIWIIVLFTKGHYRNEDVSRLESDKIFLQQSLSTNLQTTENYRLELQKSFGKVTEKDIELSRLIMERDKQQLEAQGAKNALAQWMILAQSGNTNTPLTERMDLLTKSLTENEQAFSKAVSDLMAEEPSFTVSVNGSELVPNTAVLLPKTREIFIQAKNIGGDTAERLSIHFGSPLSRTNLVIGPQWEHGAIISRPVPPFTNWTTFGIECSSPVASGYSFSAESFSVSTNWQQPFFQGQIDVFSVGSKKQTFVQVFVFTP